MVIKVDGFVRIIMGKILLFFKIRIRKGKRGDVRVGRVFLVVYFGYFWGLVFY